MKLEVNMVASDAIGAADYYKELFGAKILSKTDLEKNLNEARVQIGSVVIQILNENKDYDLIAPDEEGLSSMWLNLIVEDMDMIVERAEKMNCKMISPITEFPEMNIKNVVFRDFYNHIWVMNQIL